VKVEATVVEERPRAIYKVMLDLVGMVQRNFVRLAPGDKVEVELTPRDPTRGRIVRKLGKTS